VYNRNNSKPTIDFDEQQLMIDYYQSQSRIRKSYLSNYLDKSLGNLYNILVPEVVCPILLRVGRVLDGGKWICNPFRLSSDCVLYSMGINNEISFELDIYQLSRNNCNIFAFDKDQQSPTTIQQLSAINATLIQALITTATNNTENKLQSVIRAHKHDRHIELLKIYIEG
jgi:hypothetical protein